MICNIDCEVISSCDLKPQMDGLEEKISLFKLERHKKRKKPVRNLLLRHEREPWLKVARCIRRSESSDVTVKVGKDEYACHRIVLSLYSKKFLSNDVRPIIIFTTPRLPSRGFALLYRWMSAEISTLRITEVVDQMRAAKFLEVDELLEHYWSVLDNYIFNEFSAFSILHQARYADELVDLHKLLAGRISKAFLTIAASQQFLDLGEVTLCTLLKSSSLAVNSECEVLYSALLWLNHLWPLRRGSVNNVLKHIRYGHLAPAMLMICKAENPEEVGPFGPIIRQMKEWPELQKLIHNGVFYSSILISSSNNPEIYAEILKANNMEMVPPRRWICDLNSTYHSAVNHLSPNMRFITFREFAAYLDNLRHCKPDFDHRIKFAFDEQGSSMFLDWHAAKKMHLMRLSCAFER